MLGVGLVININGQRRAISAAELSYDDILGINKRTPYVRHTIAYKAGKTKGLVRPGDPPLEVVDDLRIDVIITAAIT